MQPAGRPCSAAALGPRRGGPAGGLGGPFRGLDAPGRRPTGLERRRFAARRAPETPRDEHLRLLERGGGSDSLLATSRQVLQEDCLAARWAPQKSTLGLESLILGLLRLLIG